MKKKLRIKETLFFIFFMLLISLSSEARYVTQEDKIYEYTFYKRDIELFKDGSYIEVEEVKIKILKEEAIQFFREKVLFYDPEFSHVEILASKIIHNKKNVSHQKAKIITYSTPMLQGYDKNQMVKISFENLKVNSEIYIKTKFKVKKASLPGLFSSKILFGYSPYQVPASINIRSEIPIFIHTNDPDQYLDIHQESVKDKFFLNVLLKRPVFIDLVHEEGSFLRKNIFPWVEISSFQNWPEVNLSLLQMYEQRVREELPEWMNFILLDAKKIQNPLEKIQAVSYQVGIRLKPELRWNLLKGQPIPRSLNEISKSSMADSKDYSAVTIAILRRLGIQADFAWIKSGVTGNDQLTHLPILNEFNHCLVRVQHEGKVFWLDPTIGLSYLDDVFYHVADRSALVFHSNKMELEKIPPVDINKSEIHLTKKVSESHLPTNEKNKKTVKKKYHIQGELELKGARAALMTGLELGTPSEKIYEKIFSFFIEDQQKIVEGNVEPFSLHSRVVKDLKFNLEYSLSSSLYLKSSLGLAYPLIPIQGLDVLMNPVKDRVSDYFFYFSPINFIKEEHLLGVKLLGKRSLECDIQSPWANVSRKIDSDKKMIVIKDQLQLKVSSISNLDLKSQLYQDFQKKMIQCFKSVQILVEPTQ